MKKSLIFVGMLAIGYAHAQQGNVGINENTPNATLHLKVASVNADNDTNQGIIIPKLTKERVAKIANTKLVKGTLVFVEGTTYTGSNTKVSQITSDGFYHYDGTNWVKGVATDTNTNIYTNDGTLSGNRTVTMGNNNLIFNGNGNVGIHTTSPSEKLQVAGNTKIGDYANSKPGTLLLDTTADGEGGQLTILKDILHGTQDWHIDQIGESNNNSRLRIFPGTNEENGIAILENGNIGLGIKYPSKKLDVAGSIKSRDLSGTGDRAVVASADGTLKAGTALQNLQGSTSIAINNNQIQREALTGDVTAAANNNTVTINNGAVTAAKLNQMNATNGQVLKWNGSQWAPAADNNTNTTYTAGNGISLNNNQFSVPIETAGDVNGNVITGVTQTANGIQVTKGNIVDTNTTYTAGNGISLTGTTFSVPINTTGTGNVITGVTQSTNGIEVTKGTLTDKDTTYTGSTSIKLNNGSFQREALTGDVTAAANNNTVTINNNAITSAKIANGTIIAEDLANNAVTTDKIANGTIKAEDLSNMGAEQGMILWWNGSRWVTAYSTMYTNNGVPGYALSYLEGREYALPGGILGVGASEVTYRGDFKLVATLPASYDYSNSVTYVNGTGTNYNTIKTKLDTGALKLTGLVCYRKYQNENTLTGADTVFNLRGNYQFQRCAGRVYDYTTDLGAVAVVNINNTWAYRIK